MRMKPSTFSTDFFHLAGCPDLALNSCTRSTVFFRLACSYPIDPQILACPRFLEWSSSFTSHCQCRDEPLQRHRVRFAYEPPTTSLHPLPKKVSGVDQFPTSPDRRKQQKTAPAMATTSAYGSQLKATGECTEYWAAEESSEWDGVGALASAAEQTTASASRTEYATTVEEQIEQSRRHWSHLAAPPSATLEDAGISTSSCSSLPDDTDEAIESDNRAVFKDLLDHPIWGGFFRIFGYDIGEWLSDGTLEVGEKFAEGAQAELFHAHVTWNDPKLSKIDEEGGNEWVLKVFKKGTLLRHLQSQWPQGFLQWWVEKTNRYELGLPLGYRWHGEIMYGTLLKDGRFAFMMTKEDEDLRRVIDRNMVEIGQNGCGPFQKEEEEDIMYHIARGMDWMHTNNIVHRDLKASNVLVRKVPSGALECFVADYECSIGVVGTGFFRAPEILQACKERNVKDKQELFIRATDVYSYGMTCYEVLTGKLPFEHHPLSDNKPLLIDLVINGLHPEVPEFVDSWKVELLQSCWQLDVQKRPTFEKILKVLESKSKSKFIVEEAIEIKEMKKKEKKKEKKKQRKKKKKESV